MTKIIGLTGGIGSGKKMVAEYFKSLGIPVYIADKEARQLMTSENIINALSNEFGKEILVTHLRKDESEPDAILRAMELYSPKYDFYIKEHFGIE